ncbi:MAG: RNA 2',3'-cyclic phosphodiesterase [Geobacteraceae bacterium]
MLRLFVAIDLPEEIKSAVSSLRYPKSEAKWVAEDQLHLTLRFIGDVDDDLIESIVTGLSGIAAAPFFLVLKGVGCFPSKREPRVLWVGIGSSDALFALQADIEKVLVLNGSVPDRRPFFPHITIARLKEVSAARIAPFLQKNSQFATGSFPVTEFILYSSTLTQQGAIHREIASFPLSG